jgi:sterile alpha motif and leucine zipper-containing kinase AZK
MAACGMLSRKKGALPRDKKLRWLIDAAKGMTYLHSKNILHADLKSLNLLVNEHGVVKIADFGLSTVKHTTASMIHGVEAFTPAYAAPEIFDDECGLPSDVYAFGIIMWEVLTCNTPFLGYKLGEIRVAVKRGTRPTIPSTTSVDAKFIALIQVCMRYFIPLEMKTK